MARKRDHGTVTIRIPADANRLATICAAMAGMSKPRWVADLIRRSAASDFPEVIARLERERRRPPRG